MSGSILAPIDFSPITGRVVAHAGQLARAMGCKLWLVHVAAPDPDFVGLGTGPEHVRRIRADELRTEHVRIQEIADGLRSSGAEVEALLVQGPTTQTILEQADRLGAGQIVMGSHGHTGLVKVLLGSVSAQVLQQARVPVTIVPLEAPR